MPQNIRYPDKRQQKKQNSPNFHKRKVTENLLNNPCFILI
ncbi:hypothetical protein HMPREF0663_11626 [Hoylesella oralis ATCC 33269]|uniref:Uncharacterized protein n=1 Tax=Hoylesella oralis ATCC 33269 TaxID=873533 RepID=E7RR25_9BACT|nr:hypothetical protein HMPREF0663_11626 [Hoylesella oralis ATCC 33269]